MLRLSALICALLMLTACTRTIVINPELTDIVASPTARPIPKRVAFYLADDMRNMAVTAPAAGGDSISYKPYQDLEVGLIKILRNTFASTIRLTAPPDLDELKRRDVHYLVTPLINTNSTSGNRALWAPTDFTLTLQCKLIDVTSGAEVIKEAVGKGKYSHAENQYSIPASHGSEAARRASLDALMKMQQVLLGDSELR